MARILLATATLAAGGGIAQVARMTRRILTEAGHEVHVVRYLDRPDGSDDICANGRRLRFALAVQREARRADLAIYDSAGLARVHALRPGCPALVWMLGVEAWEALKPGAHRALRRATRVLAISQHTLSRFEALHGALPTARLCPLATEADELPSGLSAGRPGHVLIVGRIDAAENYKGHDAMLAAWPQVVAARPDARLVIAGGGSGLDDLRRAASRSSAAQSIDVLGFVQDDRLDRLWQQAQVFAMPSRGEGFGLVYAEAMRRALPVIASVHDAGGEVNVDGQTGFNVDLARPGMLAERLVRLLADETLRMRMGAAGQRRWQETYRYSCLRSRLLPLIVDLLPDRAAERTGHHHGHGRHEAKQAPECGG